MLVINQLIHKITVEKHRHNVKIPYGLAKKLVKQNQDVAPWLTRDVLNHHLKNQLSLQPSPSVLFVSPSKKDSTPESKSSGRPKGTTIKKRKVLDVALLAAKNQVADLYYEVKQKARRQKKRVKKGSMKEIIEKVMKENNIEGETIAEAAIKKRLTSTRKRICFSKQGHISPL